MSDMKVKADECDVEFIYQKSCYEMHSLPITTREKVIQSFDVIKSPNACTITFAQFSHDSEIVTFVT